MLPLPSAFKLTVVPINPAPIFIEPLEPAATLIINEFEAVIEAVLKIAELLMSLILAPVELLLMVIAAVLFRNTSAVVLKLTLGAEIELSEICSFRPAAPRTKKLLAVIDPVPLICPDPPPSMNIVLPCIAPSICTLAPFARSETLEAFKLKFAAMVKGADAAVVLNRTFDDVFKEYPPEPEV